jgi:hypothetical protein
MAFLSNIAEGWSLFKDSLRVVRHKPILLVPILFSWIVIALIDLCAWYYLYAAWYRSEVEPSSHLALLCVYAHVFLVTITICIANIVMLEFMQQMESGQDISFSKALKEAVILDLLKIIPLAAIWAALWVVISILASAARKKRGGGSSFIFDRIQQVLRMAVFLALPAIAWENKGPFSAIAQSARIIRKHSVVFLASYTLTALTGFVMALPLLVICVLLKGGVTFPTIFWAGVIIYMGLVWTLGMYLEQMSLGLLYLWHLKWVRSGAKGGLSSVPEPDLLDNVYELKHITSQRRTDELTEAESPGAEKTDEGQLQFRTACKQALTDGKLNVDERHGLKTLALSLKISNDTMKKLFEKEKGIFLRNRAESKFRIACKNTLADGKLSVDEKHELKALGKSLKMSRQDVQRIFEDEKRIFRGGREVTPSPNVEFQFRKACRKALADGTVTPEEKRQLKSLAEFFNIPREIVKHLLEDEMNSFRHGTDP